MKLTTKYDTRVDHKFTGKCCALSEANHRLRIEHKFTGNCCEYPENMHRKYRYRPNNKRRDKRQYS